MTKEDRPQGNKAVRRRTLLGSLNPMCLRVCVAIAFRYIGLDVNTEAFSGLSLCFGAQAVPCRYKGNDAVRGSTLPYFGSGRLANGGLVSTNGSGSPAAAERNGSFVSSVFDSDSPTSRTRVR